MFGLDPVCPTVRAQTAATGLVLSLPTATTKGLVFGSPTSRALQRSCGSVKRGEADSICLWDVGGRGDAIKQVSVFKQMKIRGKGNGLGQRHTNLQRKGGESEYANRFYSPPRTSVTVQLTPLVQRGMKVMFIGEDGRGLQGAWAWGKTPEEQKERIREHTSSFTSTENHYKMEIFNKKISEFIPLHPFQRYIIFLQRNIKRKIQPSSEYINRKSIEEVNLSFV
ncbi:hypothetical protein PoB_005407700 [Plakobranchus ocellatus]|uniref:Uncharacterized protein n=1 Tax=Plakobranchus ocellatus TaxID=259542 RepID=A0AAV4C8F9_9GAST|nr:hypothetical protein PoB_005407700 [Plakobranchus ocellatus]